MFFETTLTRERVDRSTADGTWANRLLGDWLDDAVRRHPEKLAIVDGRARISWSELAALAERAARAFLAIGIRPGDVVTVQLPNWHEFAVVALALERFGGVINPVAPIFRERELGVILRLAGSRAIVGPSAFRGFDYAAMYATLRAGAPGLETTILCGGDAPAGTLAWDAFLERASATAADVLPFLRPSPDHVVQLMFTSGTTGEPKGVMHTPNTLSAGVRPLIAALGLRSDDVWHMGSTLGHQTGFLYGFHTPVHLGASIVFQEVWDAARFVEWIETEKVTFTMGATPFLADTVREVSGSKRDVSSLRIFICGGAPIPQPLAEKAGEVLPCRLAPVWGMTEVGIVTTVFHDDPAARVATTDGRALPGSEVLVRDADGRPAAAGEEGDLYARGAATFAGYVQGRRFTETFFDDEGWFSTGDRARMDEQGFIRISGRSKDLIIRGGENVPVKEVEDVLLRHPRVRNVAVVAAPHPRLGEVGCACVVAEGEPPTLAELTAFLESEKVTRQFWPEKILVLDEFPMTPSGKVQKFRLRELAAKE
jgi:cyclohexanecarboxylate-CoA ligase